MSIKVLKEVYFFNGELWYNIKYTDRTKLVNVRGYFKQFIVIDITTDRIYSRDEFLELHFPEEFNSNVSKEFNKKNEPNYSARVIEALDSLKYKVYKKINLKDQK